jgi:two-component system heavy metal sensor histidine kinase CusS
MRLKQRHSLTLRLTLLFAIASTTVLLVLGYLIGYAVETHFEEQDIELLATKIAAVKPVLSSIQTSGDISRLAQQIDASTAGHQGMAVMIRGGDRESLFAGDATILFPQSLTDCTKSQCNKSGKSITWSQGDRPLRGIASTIPSTSSEVPPILMVVAMDISHHEHFMAQFRMTLWGFVAAAALLMGLLGWFSARRGLAPLLWIKNSLGEVSASSLGQRLPVEQLPAELADLGVTLNGMLSRLEEAFGRLSGFSSDIAHELRTPVSNLMTQTQVALSRARTADEYREILASNAEELDRMARMITDMLFLAKADNNLMLLNIENLSLAKEFQELHEFYDALLEENTVKLKITGDAIIRGDKLMLRRAFSNLLSNAIRHTTVGERVGAAIIQSDSSAISVEISNPGDIPSEHLPRLFERFYRVDLSRHREGDNSGLGLAITKSIIEAHHGKICAKSSNGIVRFIVQFPVA